MIVGPVEAWWLKLVRDYLGGVRDNILIDLVFFIRLSQVHVAYTLDPEEIKFALVVRPFLRSGSQEELKDYNEGDHRIAIEFKPLVVNGLVGGRGSHGFHHDHEVLLDEACERDLVGIACERTLLLLKTFESWRQRPLLQIK